MQIQWNERMKLIPYFPRPPLSEYIEMIWAVEGIPDHIREKVLPNAAIELIINLGSYQKVVNNADSRRSVLYRESWVAGMQEHYIIIEALRDRNLIGIRFRPGGARPFLRFPISDLSNQVFEADLIFGGSIRDLRERLLQVDSHPARIRLIEDFLLKLLDSSFEDPTVTYAIQKMRRYHGQISICRLSREVGFSNKHLICRFRIATGISPKLLSRIFRFQSAIRYLRDQPPVRWTDLAQECNYYDQAHMIHEFHRFSGSSPSSYLEHRDDDENHIILD
jgi:AraC-like DNA-binding protein